MSEVPIDEQAVRDELRSIEGEYIAAGDAPPPPGADPLSDQQSPELGTPMDWTIPAGLVVMVLDRLVAPNWQLETGEKEMLHAQTVQTLQVFFPRLNLDPRWLALASLAGAIGAIAARRVDLETGSIKPLRAAPPDDDADERQAA